MKKYWLIFTLLLSISHAWAASPDAIKVSLGKGNPNSLRGGRIALNWDWQQPIVNQEQWQLLGYWDLSTAYWEVKGTLS